MNPQARAAPGGVAVLAPASRVDSPELLVGHGSSVQPRAGATAPGRYKAARSAIMFGAGLAGIGVLVWQLGSGEVLAALALADPLWSSVVVATSLVPLAGAAIALAAFAPVSVGRGDAMGVQLPAGFVSVITPPSVGQLAVNAVYLKRRGLGLPVVAAVLALTNAAGLVAALLILTLAVAVTGTSAPSVNGAAASLALLVLTVAALGLLVPGLRARPAAWVRHHSRGVAPYLRGLAKGPAPVLTGLAGELLVSAGYVAALHAALRAFDIDLPLAQTAIVVLVGNTIGSAVPTPAGLGAVEAALTAGLVNAGVPVGEAVSAVLLYRFATVWLRVPPGWLALTRLRRRGLL